MTERPRSTRPREIPRPDERRGPAPRLPLGGRSPVLPGDDRPRAPRSDRGRVITPVRAMLAIALVGSTLFILRGVLARDASQIPVLTAGFAVYGIVFSALALAGGIETRRTAADGLAGRAFVLAVLGGVAALVAAGSFALAAVLALVLGG